MEEYICTQTILNALKKMVDDIPPNSDGVHPLCAEDLIKVISDSIPKDDIELIISPFDFLPCHLEVFKINGMNGSSDDFGEVVKYSKTQYYCDKVEFVPDYSLCSKACAKYKITPNQFNYICSELQENFRVTKCGLCD